MKLPEISEKLKMIENEAYNQEHLLDLLKEMQNSQACIFDAKLREDVPSSIYKL